MPHLKLEQNICTHQNLQWVAGVDEVGRGALAGPVVAGAVILPLDNPHLTTKLAQVNDSKQLTAKKRETLAKLIQEVALTYAVGMVPAGEVDRLGILPATWQAMRQALSQLDPQPEFVLVDGHLRLPDVPYPQQPIVKGDSVSLTIAAASIVAKVTRDHLMEELARVYPEYGFQQHKGYGTAKHLAVLEEKGGCPVHRYSFARVK